MTRIIGPENNMMWSALYPKEHGEFLDRTNEFSIELLKAQIQAADGLLDSMAIWGDVAYKNILSSPHLVANPPQPYLIQMVNICHNAGIPVIYHGCGNVKRILPDYIETGIDAYNPLEAKAGLDVVDLRGQYGHTLGFCGNMDVMEWADSSEAQLKAIVLRKLNAAKGGGYIFQSDHSVPSSVSGHNYDYVVKLVREYGNYPLDLGEFDIPELN